MTAYTTKQIVERLNEIYGQLDVLLEDETILSLPREHKRIKDDLGDFIQKLQDDIDNAADEEKET